MGAIVNSVKKPVKFVLGSMASIGAGALLGYVMKNIDTSGMRGLGKICVGAGISGLALAGGTAAKNAMDNKVDESFKFLGFVEDVTDGAKSVGEAIQRFKDMTEKEMAEEAEVVDESEESLGGVDDDILS